MMPQATRMNVKTGDQIIYKATNIIGKAIGWFTKSKYSHTGTIIVIGGFVFVLEAKAKGVILISFWDSVENKEFEIRRLRKPLTNETQLLIDLNTIVDDVYNYEDFFKHAVYSDNFISKTLRKLFNIKFDNKVGAHICSGLSVFIIKKYGDFEELEDVIPVAYVPGDFKTDPILTELFA